MECQKYREKRKRLRKEVGTVKMRVAGLLRDTKLIKHTLEYIKTTGGLESINDARVMGRRMDESRQGQ